MIRFLTLLAFGAISALSNQASAGQLKPDQNISTDIGSRHRCVCSTGYRSARVVRYKPYRIRTAYLIGYDPLPYRFGSTYVWEPPYRYYRR